MKFVCSKCKFNYDVPSQKSIPVDNLCFPCRWPEYWTKKDTEDRLKNYKKSK